MVNDICDAMCTAINTEFGDQYPIYTESVKQGLVEPCFFVFCINPTINLDLGKRYVRTNQFVVQYLSDSPSDRHEKMERLFNCLELIEIHNKLFRGMNFSAETIDDFLNFTMNYDMFEYRTEDEFNMEQLTVDQRGE